MTPTHFCLIPATCIYKVLTKLEQRHYTADSGHSNTIDATNNDLHRTDF